MKFSSSRAKDNAIFHYFFSRICIVEKEYISVSQKKKKSIQVLVDI